MSEREREREREGTINKEGRKELGRERKGGGKWNENNNNKRGGRRERWRKFAYLALK